MAADFFTDEAFAAVYAEMAAANTAEAGWDLFLHDAATDTRILRRPYPHALELHEYKVAPSEALRLGGKNGG